MNIILQTLPYTARNVTEIIHYFQYPNAVTGGVFWSFIILILGIIVFAFRSDRGTESAFISTGFFCWLLSILLFIGGQLVNDWMVGATTIIFIGSLIYYKFFD